MKRLDICGEAMAMTTEIRPEISRRSPYWISKHRYYELKHFCLQYPEWRYLYMSLDSISENNPSGISDKNKVSDPVHGAVEQRLYLRQNMDLIENCCNEADPIIGRYIFMAVTNGFSFVQLQMQHNIPCGKDMYYDRYRKFFYLLSVRKKHIIL